MTDDASRWGASIYLCGHHAELNEMRETTHRRSVCGTRADVMRVTVPISQIPSRESRTSAEGAPRAPDAGARPSAAEAHRAVTAAFDPRLAPHRATCCGGA